MRLPTLLFAAALALAACGLKDDLYLPEAPAAATPTSRPTPDEAKAEEDEDPPPAPRPE